MSKVKCLDRQLYSNISRRIDLLTASSPTSGQDEIVLFDQLAMMALSVSHFVELINKKIRCQMFGFEQDHYICFDVMKLNCS